MKKGIIGRYDRICLDIVEEFSRKQGLEFEGWENGGGVKCSGIVFNFGDIVEDIRSGAEAGLIGVRFDYGKNRDIYLEAVR